MTDTKHPQNKKTNPDDLVYFRFGKSGAVNLEKVRAISAAKGCTMANVIRDLITRGLDDYETEKAILAAHKGNNQAAMGAGN